MPQPTAPTYAYPSEADYTSWGQSVGVSLPSNLPASIPPVPTTIRGHYVDLVPVTRQAIRDWWSLLGDPSQGYDRLWTYMLDGPFVGFTAETFEEYQWKFCHESNLGAFFAIIPKLDFKTGQAIPEDQRRSLGRFALIRTDINNKGTEVGHVVFSPLAQRSPWSTEPFYLLGKHVFEELHFRRWEWKCHSMNEPSKKAAERLGFTFEGIFRKHYVVKGRTRDTAWFAVVEDEWPVVKQAFEQWLRLENFDDNGKQKRGLKEIRHELAKAQESK